MVSLPVSNISWLSSTMSPVVVFTLTAMLLEAKLWLNSLMMSVRTPSSSSIWRCWLFSGISWLARASCWARSWICSVACSSSLVFQRRLGSVQVFLLLLQLDLDGGHFLLLAHQGDLGGFQVLFPLGQDDLGAVQLRLLLVELPGLDVKQAEILIDAEKNGQDKHQEEEESISEKEINSFPHPAW